MDSPPDAAIRPPSALITTGVALAILLIAIVLNRPPVLAPAPREPAPEAPSPSEAEEYPDPAELRAAIEGDIVFLGADHPDTLADRDHLVAELLARGLYPQAETELRILVVLRGRALGAEHAETLRTRYTLARSLHNQYGYDDAKIEHRAVRDIRTRVLGPEHPDTLASRYATAFVIASRDGVEKAEAEFRAVWQLRERVLGHDHPDTSKSRNDFEGFSRWNHTPQALALIVAKRRKDIAAREWKFGPGDPETLLLRFGLVPVLVLQDKTEEALREARKLHADCRRTFGDRHEYTESARDLVRWREEVAAGSQSDAPPPAPGANAPKPE